MVTYVKGNLFTSPSQIITNTVNTVGVMGKGIALEFKKRYPEMYLDYKQLCDDHILEIGKLVLWKKANKWILLFPTKKNWKNPSRLEYIEWGLQKLAKTWDQLGANTISLPRLGCGNGGLDWDDVRPIMEKYLKPLPLQSYVYVGNYNDSLSEHEDITEIEKWLQYKEGLFGYNGFKTRLIECVNYNSDFFSERFHLTQNDGILIVGEKRIEDSALFEFWSLVTDAGIIDTENIPSEFSEFSDGVFEAMHRLNDLTRVFVSNDGTHFPVKPNAYQCIRDQRWAYGL